MASAVSANPVIFMGRKIVASTEVTFPFRQIEGRSIVQNIARLVDGKVALLLGSTPFHPVDQHWPDQPADRGEIQVDGFAKPLVVDSCQIFAVHKETQEVKGAEKISRAEKNSWWSVVAHVVDPQTEDFEGLIGKEATAKVDLYYRQQLSLQHSASHLAAFALNLSTRHLWSKEAPKKDSLGSPNLDNLAIEDASTILPDRNEDRYRFGKSIRKNGLQVDLLFEQLPTIQASVNALLSQWIATKTRVDMSADGPTIDSRRAWRCELPAGSAEIPCGGTHVTNLGAFGRIEYELMDATQGAEKRLVAVLRAYPA